MKAIRKYEVIFLFVLVFGIAFASILGHSYDSAVSAQTPSPGKTALILESTIDDIGWGTLHHKGLQALKDQLGYEIAFSENVPPSEWENAARSYAEQGYKYVIMGGPQFTDVTARIAPDYPETMFLVTAAVPPLPDKPYPKNMVGIDPMNEQSGYLAGVLAAGMTNTNKTGIVAGFDYPNLVRMYEAFKLGAVTQNPQVTLFQVYIGSFLDVAKGFEAATGQFDAGTDVIFQDLDRAAFGVITAVEENPGVWLIGNTNDQSSLAPNTTLTSAIMNHSAIILNGIKGLDAGNITGGEFYRWGIKEGVTGLAPYHETESKIPAELKAKIEDLKKQMINGTFVVPEIYEKDGYKKNIKQ